MKKSILNLGKALNKIEQKTINGGGNECSSPSAKFLCMTQGICEPGCGPFHIV